MKSHSLYIQDNIFKLFMVYIGRWEVYLLVQEFRIWEYLQLIVIAYLHCCDVLMWQGNLTGKREPI